MQALDNEKHVAMSDNIDKRHFDVIIVGGGVTGAGVARDCALRGLSVLLIERGDYCSGASGRNHGLMHSGARYAVTDGESARECIAENIILRHIASHCIEQTDGLFVTLPEDDPGYQATFVDACNAAGIRADVLDPADALQLEPALNPGITGAVRVPDAAVDPFRLTTANLLDANLHGATTLNYHEVTDLIVEQHRVVGVRAIDRRSREQREFRATVTINAAGIWGAQLLQRAGVTLNMFPAKGAMLIFGRRVNKMVINRCRKPSNADILVPDDTVSVIGTTSDRITIDQIDDMRVSADEVDTLLSGSVKLVPSLATTRILRAFAGVRPLVAADDDPSGRSISRGIVCIDHDERDGMAGLITITGGKLMTYRLMAQLATDMACRKLGNDRACETATTPLPGSRREMAPLTLASPHALKSARSRHGDLADEMDLTTGINRVQICECQGVSVGEIEYAVQHFGVRTLGNLRRRTRLGMGVCQGKMCAARAACLMGRLNGDVQAAKDDLAHFLDERWRGIKPVAWGNALREAQLTATIYQGLCGLDMAITRKEGDA